MALTVIITDELVTKTRPGGYTPKAGTPVFIIDNDLSFDVSDITVSNSTASVTQTNIRTQVSSLLTTELNKLVDTSNTITADISIKTTRYDSDAENIYLDAEPQYLIEYTLRLFNS